MVRFTLSASVLFLAASVSVFGQEIDPVGFCPPPATTATCTTANGLGGETIAVGATTFGMFKNGNGGTPNNPWVLLLAVPDDVGGAPTITSDGGAFTQVGTTADKGQFLPTTAGDLYTFAGLSGDNSMNAPNLFCDGASYPCASSNEISAFGSLPTFFEVFAYTFSPDIANNTAYSFSVGGSGLADGTFLAAAGGTNPFTTPFTVAGLADAPSAVPEPTSILLLLTVGVIAGNTYRKKVRVS